MNLEKKNLEILSTTDGKKKLEIDCKNLENSEICTDEKSRDLRFSRNVILEIFLLIQTKNLEKKNSDFWGSPRKIFLRG